MACMHHANVTYDECIRLHDQRFITTITTPARTIAVCNHCNHCYCGKANINGIDHRVCCNCGNRQAI